MVSLPQHGIRQIEYGHSSGWFDRSGYHVFHQLDQPVDPLINRDRTGGLLQFPLTQCATYCGIDRNPALFCASPEDWWRFHERARQCPHNYGVVLLRQQFDTYSSTWWTALGLVILLGMMALIQPVTDSTFGSGRMILLTSGVSTNVLLSFHRASHSRKGPAVLSP